MAPGDADRPLPGAPHAHGRASIYLQPGNVHSASEPTAITTVLGSCVSVCLYDPRARVGGMNHFLLPNPVNRERSARFGNVAMEELVEAVTRLGASLGSLRAKVFGGAAVLGTTRPSSKLHLGEENARLALGALLDLGIPMVDGDVGGNRGRKVVFFTDDGTAWMRTL
ncbi:MAG: chemotaxis protein CheD [Deltaproteobacteria bacterium]|nr:chemotaxis protein CheD [Deltaproteobacteria bacterium]